MSATPLESIYQGLLNFIVAAVPANTFPLVSRRLASPDQTPSESTPSLMQMQGKQQAEYKLGSRLPYKWLLTAEEWIYVNTGQDQSVIRATIYNPIIDGIRAAFRPKTPDGFITLGGLVYDSKIDAIDVYDGFIDPYAVVIVSIQLLAVDI